MRTEEIWSDLSKKVLDHLYEVQTSSKLETERDNSTLASETQTTPAVVLSNPMARV